MTPTPEQEDQIFAEAVEAADLVQSMIDNSKGADEEANQ